MKQKGLNDITKIGKFEIMFYDNIPQLEHNACVGDFFRCTSIQGIVDILGDIEMGGELDVAEEVKSEWKTQKDKIVAELCKLQMSNQKFIFRIYYNYKDGE